MNAPAARIDTDALRASVDIVDVVGAYVKLKRDGSEWKGCCPFHQERTPSFYVSPAKGFVHCFGCGAHHDVIAFVMRHDHLEFKEACEKLGHRDYAPIRESDPVAVEAGPVQKWVPLLPVPDDAPNLLRDDGWTVPIWNPKRAVKNAAGEIIGYGRHSRFKPTRADAYRNSAGVLLGYVLRCEFGDGKITPTITWCIGPDGAMQWCIRPFPTPRPLCGLDDLAAKPLAPVLMPEGEKCRAAGAGALPMYAVVTWPGGGKGIPYVDWSPLAGRDVVLWPDADQPGRDAMLGHRDYSGLQHPGVAQFLQRAGVRSMRYIDPDGQPKGWDLADALNDGWTPRQLATWAAQRVGDLEVIRG
ncbi:MAG: CHC2 zinc finger domain-containing protein [Luteimonas sp.]